MLGALWTAAFHFAFIAEMGDYFASYRDTSFTETHVILTKMPNGQQLSLGVEQITEELCQRAFTGAVGSSTRLTTGFSYVIDTGRLSSATVTGSDLPATTCTYDPNYDLIGCVDGTIDVNASWTGQSSYEGTFTFTTEPVASPSRHISTGLSRRGRERRGRRHHLDAERLLLHIHRQAGVGGNGRMPRLLTSPPASRSIQSSTARSTRSSSQSVSSSAKVRSPWMSVPSQSETCCLEWFISPGREGTSSDTPAKRRTIQPRGRHRDGRRRRA